MLVCQNQITDYVSANFTEDETLWSSSATYLRGEEIRFGHYLYKYAGIAGTNTSNDPTTDTDYWVQSGTSNYYSMLGERTSDQTIVADKIEIEFDLNRFDTIALLNMYGTELTIEITDLATSQIVETLNYDLLDRDVYNYTTWFFAPFDFKETLLINISLYTNCRAKLTLNNLGDFAKIGRLVVGRSIDIGITLFGGSMTHDSYSTESFNEFGDPTLIKRGSFFNENYTLKVKSSNVPYLKKLRKQLNTIPVLFIGTTEDNSIFQNLLSYGLWQTYSISLEGPVMCTVQHNHKELL